METEKERRDTQKAMLYDLRLLIKGSDKEKYTKEELLDLRDTTAAAKDQEKKRLRPPRNSVSLIDEKPAPAAIAAGAGSVCFFEKALAIPAGMG